MEPLSQLKSLCLRQGSNWDLKVSRPALNGDQEAGQNVPFNVKIRKLVKINCRVSIYQL